MRVRTNLESLLARNQLLKNQNNLAITLERLSTGLRINRAADDAAGLAISEKMRVQIQGMGQAKANIQDGINLIQSAEGGMDRVFDLLQRMRELAIQSANETNTQSDRGKIQFEIEELKNEITRLSQTTEFNTRKLLDGSLSKGEAFNQNSFAEVVKNFRVGANSVSLPDIRDFVQQVQAMATMVTMDSTLSMKLVANSSGGVAMEVRSSVLGLITTVNNILDPSSSFGISVDSLTGTSNLLTLDLNKGGFLRDPIDTNTPLASLIAVKRFENFAAGTFDITVNGTNYSINVDPATSTINSIIADINALSNATHMFTATFFDALFGAPALFNIQVFTPTQFTNFGAGVVGSANYTSTPPVNYGPGTAVGAIPPSNPTPNLPVVNFNYTAGTPAAFDFPDLDVGGLDTRMTVTSSGGGTFTAAVGGLNVLAGQERLISAFNSTYQGTAVANALPAGHDSWTVTTTGTFSNVTSSDTNATNTGGGLVAGATWAAQGINFATGDIDVSVLDGNGAAQVATALAVADTETVATTIGKLQAALNAVDVGGSESYTVALVGGELQIIHNMSKAPGGGAGTVVQTNPAFVPADAPIAFGGTTGPANYGPGSPVLDPRFPDPAGVGPPIILDMQLSGTSGIEDSLFIQNVFDGADAVFNEYQGIVIGQTAGMHGTYDLGTVQTEVRTNQNNTLSTRSIGSAFMVSLDDINQEAIIQIHAQRREAIEDNALTFQIGANEGQTIRVGLDELSTAALNIEDLSVLGTNDIDSHMQSQYALGMIDVAIDRVVTMRTKLGAIQNRLEFSLGNISITQENITASESRIREIDYAKSTAALTKSQILVQAGTAILAQANTTPQLALSLLS